MTTTAVQVPSPKAVSAKARLKKIAIRKTGPVRLTSLASPGYVWP